MAGLHWAFNTVMTVRRPTTNVATIHEKLPRLALLPACFHPSWVSLPPTASASIPSPALRLSLAPVCLHDECLQGAVSKGLREAQAKARKQGAQPPSCLRSTPLDSGYRHASTAAPRTRPGRRCPLGSTCALTAPPTTATWGFTSPSSAPQISTVCFSPDRCPFALIRMMQNGNGNSCGL